MGKKNKKQRQEKILGAAPAAAATVARSEPRSSRPTVLFGVGDADFGYTEGKILGLAERIQAQSGWHVAILAHDQDTFNAAKKTALDVRLVGIDPRVVTMADRLQATDQMIRETANIEIPGSTLPLWKVLAMDDFLSSLQLFGARPSDLLSGDAIIVPIMAVDNNTKGACGLYTWMIAEARRKNIPVIGLEVSPLGNKYTLSHFAADHFAVKTEWSRDFLVREGLAQPDRVSILRWEESYLLWSGKDEYTEAYLEHEAKMRGMLKIAGDDFVVLIPHHVAFLWETRKILDALSHVNIPVTVVIRVDSRTTRRQFPEREIVLETYVKEIRRLHRVVIDEQVGVGLLLQLADLVISPFAGTTTERAALCRKPTIICQAMAQEGRRGEFTYWEPRPERLAELIHSWRADGWLARLRFARLLEALKQAAGNAPRADGSALAPAPLLGGDSPSGQSLHRTL